MQPKLLQIAAADLNASIQSEGDGDKKLSADEAEPIYYHDLMTEEFENNDTRFVRSIFECKVVISFCTELL